MILSYSQKREKTIQKILQLLQADGQASKNPKEDQGWLPFGGMLKIHLD